MSNRNKFLKKKYHADEAKTNLLYFYLPCIKANELRKLRRFCILNHMRIIFLPSSFAFTKVKASHGPSSVCALTENFSFPELAFANTHQVSCFSLKNRYKMYPGKKENYKNSKTYAMKIISIFHINLKKLSEK